MIAPPPRIYSRSWPASATATDEATPGGHLPLTLLVEDGTDDRARTLGGAVITLGRVPGNDIVVTDATFAIVG